MQRRHVWWSSLLFATSMVPCAVAQGIPAGAATAATGVASAAPASAPTTLWSFLGCSWDQKEDCRRMLCKMPIGQLLNNASAPIGMMSGGIIPGFCPQTPSADQLKDQGPVGAAAAIKADEAAAKERRAAVRYLGTVDCHYWPEAQDALIASLRGDRNECVRFEAALALGHGCCCTKKTMEALMNAITCNNRDDFPRETSGRVQAAARQALDGCLACFQDMTPVEPIKNIPEKSKNNKDDANPEKSGDKSQKSSLGEPRKLGEATARERPTKMVYYAKINEQPIELIVREGRRVLSITQPMPVSGSNSFAKLIDRASGVPETRGYIVHGGQPGQAEVVASKPTNLWELMTGRNQPVIVSSYPAKSALVQDSNTPRVVPQPNTTTIVQTPIAPKSMAATAGTISSPAQQTVQPPPLMPELKSAPIPVVTTPVPSPLASKPVTVPVSSPAKASVVQTTQASQTVPSSRPASTVVPPPPVAPPMTVVVAKPAPSLPQATTVVPPTSVAPPPTVVVTRPTPTIQTVQSTATTTVVNKPAAPVAKTEPARPSATPRQNLLEKISMGSVHERVIALESLPTAQKASPELTAQLIKTAEQDSNEYVRCAAIRAMARTGVPAGRAIPVLAQLAMEPDTNIGKEANQALAQINLQLTGGSK